MFLKPAQFNALGDAAPNIEMSMVVSRPPEVTSLKPPLKCCRRPARIVRSLCRAKQATAWQLPMAPVAAEAELVLLTDSSSP